MMPALLLALALLWRAAPAAAQNLDRTKWAVTYSSQQNSDAEIALAEYAVDGKTGTWWLSQYDPFLEVFPQHITFTWANQKAAVTGLVYQPRLVTPDTPWLADGRIGGYEVLVSTDGATFTKTVAKGTWGDNSDAKTVTWPSEAGVVAVRLRCLSAANPKGQICNAAEVNVVGTYAAGGTPPPPPPPPPPSVPAADPPGGTQPAPSKLLAQTGWKVTASSQQNSAAEVALAASAADGETGTWWLTSYDPNGVQLPQYIQFDLGKAAAVTGLVYQPRLVTADTPWLAEGRIGGYEVLVSTDGATFTKSVAKGTWGDNSDAKTVTWPQEAGVTAVRLRCISEATAVKHNICNAAEVNIIGEYGAGTGTPPPTTPPPTTPPPTTPPPAGATLDQADWDVTASSQQNSPAEVALAASAADGKVGTWWLTQYDPNGVQLPQYIQFMWPAKTASVTGLVYQPRQATADTPWLADGRIGGYEVLVSTDGATFTKTVAQGTWADTSAAKTVTWPEEKGVVGVRLRCLSEADKRGNICNAAEVNILGAYGAAPPPTPAGDALPRAGWSAVPDSQQVRDGEFWPGKYVLDGIQTNMWHTQWIGDKTRPQFTPNFDTLPHKIDIIMGGQTNSVSGLKYLPRQDGGKQGFCGKYEIRLSQDGSTYPATAVAAGTWADTAAEKTATWPAKACKSVRLTCLTEAGGRGPWTSAAEINILGTAGALPDPKVEGKWTPLIDFPLVPVGAAGLPNNRVLVWSAFGEERFGVGDNAQTVTAIYNGNTGAITEATVTNTKHDMFCSGISMLGNGDIVVTGGDTTTKTSIFKHDTDTWVPGPDMNVGRGYQAQTTTEDGQVFVHGGSFSGGIMDRLAEVFDPSAATVKWTQLKNINTASILTNDRAGMYRSDNHGWYLGWSDNAVFHCGPAKTMHWFNIAGDGTQNVAGTRAGGSDQMNGNAVMFDSGKILTVGGAPSYDGVDSLNTAQVVTLGASNQAVTSRSVAPMKYTRGFGVSVALPDGKVFTVGGQPFPMPFTDTDAVFVPELWDPATETWTSMAIQSAPRTYHSVAVLMSDGRVYSGGGGLCTQNTPPCATNHFDAQIFSPPYLFNGARPTIDVTGTANGIANNGQDLKVNSNEALKIISIIRYGTTTHAVDTDQRRIQLCGPGSGACSNTNANTVTIPADAGKALPGRWMLFGVNNAGTPSVAFELTIGKPPQNAFTATKVQPAATGAKASDPGGTAAPVAQTFAATPPPPDVPYPANLQNT